MDRPLRYREKNAFPATCKTAGRAVWGGLVASRPHLSPSSPCHLECLPVDSGTQSADLLCVGQRDATRGLRRLTPWAYSRLPPKECSGLAWGRGETRSWVTLMSQCHPKSEKIQDKIYLLRLPPNLNPPNYQLNECHCSKSPNCDLSCGVSLSQITDMHLNIEKKGALFWFTLGWQE